MLCLTPDLVRNRAYPQSHGGLRVNLGNIYFEQQKFSLAIKNYRMALDQVPQTGKEVSVFLVRSHALYQMSVYFARRRNRKDTSSSNFCAFVWNV